MENPSDLVFKARFKLNLSQQEFAALIGVHQGTISAWETGAMCPNRIHMAKINLLLEKKP